MELKKLTKKEAIKMVENIYEERGDDETAHWQEDNLRRHFIECAAAGMYTKKECIEIAAEILKTKDIEFSRWYA